MTELEQLRFTLAHIRRAATIVESDVLRARLESLADEYEYRIAELEAGETRAFSRRHAGLG